MSTTPYTEAWLPGFDGHQFYTRTWPAESPKAVTLYVHGFGDHIGRYDHIHVRWPQHGITLFAYDLRGFGRTALDEAHRSPDASYGKTSRDLELADVEWWIEHVAKAYPGLPIFLMGYSAVRITLLLVLLTSAARADRPHLFSGGRPDTCLPDTHTRAARLSDRRQALGRDCQRTARSPLAPRRQVHARAREVSRHAHPRQDSRGPHARGGARS